MSSAARSYDVAIVGAGFAGSILARILVRAGLQVCVVERGRHPRFALGESSTPLASIALERLSRRYGLPDLADLSTYGRWDQQHPTLRKGLKRGFTFYRHRAGEALDPNQRLLVAASPNDRVADCHWRRADVDHHLCRRAALEGAEVREDFALESIARQIELPEANGGHLGSTKWGLDRPSRPAAWRLVGRREDREEVIEAGFVVDASGSPILASQLEPAAVGRGMEGPRPQRGTCLIANHLIGVPELSNSEPAGSEPPYPAERAAVHHLLEEGWVYALRFDDGVVSVGAELSPEAAEALLGRSVQQVDGEALWKRLRQRYPTLQAQFGGAEALMPWICRPEMSHRGARAAGHDWLALPHAFAFVSPLFSTGLAWSLVGVERAASLLIHWFGAGQDDSGGGASWKRYEELLDREAVWIARLVAGALRWRHDLESFTTWSLIYFGAASWSEARQRLLGQEPETNAGVSPEKRGDAGWAWTGFLGCEDPLFEQLLSEAEAAETAEALRQAVFPALKHRDVGAWTKPPAQRGMYPVDFEALVAAASLLDLDEATVRAALPRLRGGIMAGDASQHSTEEAFS